jgi:DNA-directed RNA polymerase subunit beta
LFSRAVKDRKLKSADKANYLTKLEKNLRETEELKVKLVDKLFILVNGKTSQGVKDYLKWM